MTTLLRAVIMFLLESCLLYVAALAFRQDYLYVAALCTTGALRAAAATWSPLYNEMRKR